MSGEWLNIGDRTKENCFSNFFCDLMQFDHGYTALMPEENK
jgi:hypothetical protein